MTIHHRQEWFLDSKHSKLDSRHGIEWRQFAAVRIRRLRFGAVGELCDEPVTYSYNMVSTTTIQIYVEIKYMKQCQHTVTSLPQNIVPYHSSIGTASGALSRHIQRLMGDMKNFQLHPGQDYVTEVDIIITTDGSVLFRAVYHSWLVATTYEEILMVRGVPDDGTQQQMASYRSELGGIATGLGVLDILSTRCSRHPV
jgi:hypothetical protein